MPQNNNFPAHQYFQELAHATCMGLFSRLDEYSEDFHSGSPLELIQLLKEIIKKTDLEIEDCVDLREIEPICYILGELSQLALTHLDTANKVHIPKGLIQILTHLNQLIYPNSRLLVTPQIEHNYSIRDLIPTLVNLTTILLDSSDVRQIFSRFTRPFNAVSFPRISRDNILTHAILGHELGHPVAKTYLEQYFRSADYRTKSKRIRLQIEHAFADEAGSRKKDKIAFYSGKFVCVNELFKRGMEELIADAVGVFLFGPSTLFASTEFLYPRGLDDLPVEPLFYPPSRYRLRRMYEILDKEGQIGRLEQLRVSARLRPVKDALNSYLAFIREEVSSCTDLEAIKSDRVIHIAYEWLEHELAKAVSHAKSICRSALLKSDLIGKPLLEGVERLHLNLPPTEHGTYPALEPIDWRIGILAGWIEKIFVTAKRDAGWESRRKALQDLDSLVLKGIEDSILLVQYRQAQNNH